MSDPNSSPPSSAVRPGFVRARFVRDHYLGLPLTTGILAVIATTLLFTLIAIEVSTHGALTVLDQQLSDWFNRHAVAPVTRFVLSYTHLHGTIGVLVMGALLAWHMLSARQWHWLLDLLLVLPGGMLFNYGLKHIFARVRPSFQDPILVLHSYSFPSGHTIGAALFYAVLAAYIVNQPGIVNAISTRLRWRVGTVRTIAISAAIVLTALTGFSRVYLGAHFLSDVLAASLLALAWFALWTTIVFTTRGHYSAQLRSN